MCAEPGSASSSTRRVCSTLARQACNWVLHPRRGKPVEIQALWYNAVRVMEDIAGRLGDESARKRYNNMAALTKWSFNRLFWNEKGGYLYDVVNGGPP
jgi:glycogen debranching enzyme